MPSNRWRYFSESTDPKLFRCPCCGKPGIKYELVDILDRIRNSVGLPMAVNSGIRCEKHNEATRGSKNSEHMTGEGVDIRVTTSGMRYLLIEHGLALGINRFGIGDDFVHVGISSEKAQNVIWTY